MPATAYEEPTIGLIPEKDWVIILVVDDDEEFLDRVKVNFEMNNFTTVDVSPSPQDAVERLKSKERPYDALIADIDFDNSDISGDEFVVDNIDLIGEETRILMVTGLQRNQLKLGKRFSELNIPVRDKLEDEWRNIVSEVIEDTREKKIKVIEQKLEGLADIKPDFSPYKPELEVKRLFMDWLVNFSNPEEKVFLLGGNALSAFELAEEVEKGSSIGIRLLKMFIREIRHSLKLNIGEKNGNSQDSA